MRARLSSILLAATLAAACDKTDPDQYSYPTGETSSCAADLTTPDGFVQAVKCAEYKSCAFECSGCGETTQPYACPAMRSWSSVVHAGACGSFDGATMPTVTPGACSASAPSGDAVAPAGADAAHARRVRLPDGHFIEPAGHEQVLSPPNVKSGFPLNALLVPGTRFAVVTDSGVDDNAIEVVDLDLLAQDKPALVSSLPFPQPAQLYQGLAFVPPSRVYASGGGGGVVYALSLDTSTGAITRDAAADLTLMPAGDGSTFYAGGIATSADGKSLLVLPSTGDTRLRVVDLASKSESAIDLGGSSEFFDLVRDPNDPSGAFFWASSLDARAVFGVDVAAKKVAATLPTDENPEGIAILDASHIAVASSDGDTLAVYESTTGKLVQKLAAGDGPNGLQPGALAYDAASKTLYASLSGVNAVGVYAYDASASAPLTPRGEIPSAWWPTAVRVRGDGSLVTLSGKGHGTGAANRPYPPGQGAVSDDTRGSIAIAFPKSLDLAAASATATASRAIPGGQPSVDCGGKPYDFPIPATNTGAPSAIVQHIVYVLRENKTFDAIFGDLPNVNGAPTLVMSPGKMDEYWRNARALAKTFAISDNYYVDAEQSIQGHVWSTFGRSTDYVERTWTTSYSRGRKPKSGIDRRIGYAKTGSVFDWLEAANVPYDDFGEIVGMSKQGFDPSYPGLVYTVLLPDVDKACFLAAKARATCDLKAFSYVVLPNDHTQGGAAGAPVPELMIAVNDEATGMIVDAISHSPEWASTLVVIVEDDPQNGGDHVDSHRTPILFVSPWVKRNYVSPTHIDAASVHKLFAHVLAKPYLSETVANAPLPLDLFTSTPDYTPFTYAPRTTETTCNKSGTKEAHVAEGWDFSRPDEQPGLKEQVDARMRAIAR